MLDRNRNFVTVVSGLPRSGTSMMMSMLEAGGMPVLVDNVRRADEDNPRGYYEFELVKKTAEDPSWLDRARGRAVKLVYRLLYDLPASHEYRVLFMRRRIEEVLASQRAMLKRQSQTDEDIRDDQLMRLFHQEIDRCLTWLGRQDRFATLEVNFHRIFEDASPVLEVVSEFLGGHLDVQAMRRIVEPSLYRQRR